MTVLKDGVMTGFKTVENPEVYKGERGWQA